MVAFYTAAPIGFVIPNGLSRAFGTRCFAKPHFGNLPNSRFFASLVMTVITGQVEVQNPALTNLEPEAVFAHLKTERYP